MSLTINKYTQLQWKPQQYTFICCRIIGRAVWEVIWGRWWGVSDLHSLLIYKLYNKQPYTSPHTLLYVNDNDWCISNVLRVLNTFFIVIKITSRLLQIRSNRKLWKIKKEDNGNSSYLRRKFDIVYYFQANIGISKSDFNCFEDSFMLVVFLLTIYWCLLNDF